MPNYSPWRRCLKTYGPRIHDLAGTVQPPRCQETARWITYLSSRRSQESQSPDVPSPASNIPGSIWARVGRNLHLQRGHPLNNIKENIEDYFRAKFSSEVEFHTFDNFSPICTTKQCFDDLLVAKDHPSRSRSDTYYVDEHQVLRTHMTAHDIQLLRQHYRAFLTSGDVYRRDTVDCTHFPVFHQLDGVRVFDHNRRNEILDNLKHTLSGLATHLFGKDIPVRWVDAEFPFTYPSLEMEIFFNGEWLEVLGCGELRDGVLKSGNVDPEIHRGWAFGLGLERLAMILYDIPDIRLFWSDDPRFVSQFKPGQMAKFVPISKFPVVLKDIAFWLDPEKSFHENDLNELVRDVAGILVEKVECIDQFVNPKTKKSSKCFRITYRSMDRTLTNDEIDILQFRIRDECIKRLGVELR